MKRLEIGSKEYERLANRLARDYVTIQQCKKCWHPCVEGYCCAHCKDSNPDWTVEQQAAWDLKHGDKP